MIISLSATGSVFGFLLGFLGIGPMKIPGFDAKKLFTGLLSNAAPGLGNTGPNIVSGNDEGEKANGGDNNKDDSSKKKKSKPKWKFAPKKKAPPEKKTPAKKKKPSKKKKKKWKWG